LVDVFKIHAWDLIPIIAIWNELEHNSLPMGVSSIRRKENALPGQWWEESMVK
jgi:hypothetical protein